MTPNGVDEQDTHCFIVVQGSCTSYDEKKASISEAL